MGNAISAQEKVKCEWVETAYDGIIPALNAKKLDTVLSAMSMTPKRKTQEAYAQDEWLKKDVNVVSYQNQGFVNQDLAS